MAFGMANFVARFGATASEVTSSAHKILLNSYKNQSIIERLSWQESRFDQEEGEQGNR